MTNLAPIRIGQYFGVCIRSFSPSGGETWFFIDRFAGIRATGKTRALAEGQFKRVVTLREKKCSLRDENPASSPE